jgi:hypothetical protein
VASCRASTRWAELTQSASSVANIAASVADNEILRYQSKRQLLSWRVISLREQRLFIKPRNL